MHLNIHNSIFTFKEFLKACQNAKAKIPLSNMATEVPGKLMLISERKTLVFDMDETLIHTNERITNNF